MNSSWCVDGISTLKVSSHQLRGGDLSAEVERDIPVRLLDLRSDELSNNGLAVHALQINSDQAAWGCTVVGQIDGALFDAGATDVTFEGRVHSSPVITTVSKVVETLAGAGSRR